MCYGVDTLPSVSVSLDRFGFDVTIRSEFPRLSRSHRLSSSIGRRYSPATSQRQNGFASTFRHLFPGFDKSHTGIRSPLDS